MFLLGRGGGSGWLASRLLECRVCVGAPQLCQEPALWFFTTEPGAGPCPSPWPLSPGPAGTKGPALSYTELRDEDDPYGQGSLGPQRDHVDASQEHCFLVWVLSSLYPQHIHRFLISLVSQRKQMENTWLSWAPNSSLFPQVLLSDTGESIGFGQLTLALTS